MSAPFGGAVFCKNTWENELNLLSIMTVMHGAARGSPTSFVHCLHPPSSSCMRNVSAFRHQRIKFARSSSPMAQQALQEDYLPQQQLPQACRRSILLTGWLTLGWSSGASAEDVVENPAAPPVTESALRQLLSKLPPLADRCDVYLCLVLASGGDNSCFKEYLV